MEYNIERLDCDVTQLEPVLCRVGLHQVLVWVEEDAPILIDTGHPDGENRSLEAGAEVEAKGFLFVGFPVKKSNVISASYPNLAFSILEY